MSWYLKIALQSDIVIHPKTFFRLVLIGALYFRYLGVTYVSMACGCAIRNSKLPPIIL